MIIKLVDTASYYSPDEPQVTVIHGDMSELTKEAADSRIKDYISNHLIPKEGMTYLHINAMGAGEYYGSNKNGDYFPEANLRNYYKTFETSPAHIFRHHINKDPAKAIGKVIFAIYNDRMHRVELIAEVSKTLGQDIEDKISSGEYPLTSMACKTPYDICSICGNRAHTRQEYCSHLRNELNTLRPDGRKTMALNDGPLRFFDMSIVIRPADITSSILEKVASNSAAVSSAELAEDEDILTKKANQVKEAALHKLSELIKVVDGGQVISSDPSLQKILEVVKDPKDSLISTLSKFSWNEILNTLAESGINPSIRFMAELLCQKAVGEDGVGMGDIVTEILLRVHPKHIPEEANRLLPDVDNAESNPILKGLVSKLLSDTSLSSTFVEKRASDGGAGYANWGNGMTQLPVSVTGPMLSKEDLMNQMAARGLQPGNNGGLFKTLLTLGGAALMSRFYISSLMDAKFKDKERMILENRLDFLEKNINYGNSAKLNIVKSAESVLSDAGNCLLYSNFDANITAEELFNTK